VRTCRKDGTISAITLLLAQYRFNRGATREYNEKLLMRGFINKIIITISGRIHFSTSYNARVNACVPLVIVISLSRDRVSGVVESRGVNVKPF